MPIYPFPSNIGVIKRVTGTNPAAGVECSDTVPVGKSWWLMSVTVSCVQGLTQTPWPSLIIDDGTVIIFQGFSGTAAMSISTTTQHTWAPNLQTTGSTASTVSTGPLPFGLNLPAGYRIRTVTTGIGAATDFGAPSYFVCELG